MSPSTPDGRRFPLLGRRLGLVEAALAYAARGWPVFPLVPDTKRPACPAHTADRCDRTDPFCRHGHTTWEQRATRDPDRIRRAWSIRPYGIGIACGPAGLLVIDTDLHKPTDRIPEAWWSSDVRSGDRVLARLATTHGQPLPATYTVATPSGGFHRYYLAPMGVKLGNTTGKLGWLIDTRGRGGYVVAPPTRLTQHGYTRLDGYPDPVPLPDWITDLLTAPHNGAQQPASTPQTAQADRPAGRPAAGPVRSPVGYAAAALAGESSHVRDAQPGSRNHTLFCAAVALGQLVGAGQLDEPTVRDLLLAACVDHVRDGAFTTAEAAATIASGLSRGKTQPRTRNGRNVA